jgi:putative ABC transport system permease protein
MLWWRRRRRDEDLERELRAHLELEAGERQERGLSAEDARYAARRALGNAALVKEDTRAAWSGVSLEGIWQDLRFAVRAMLKRPGVSCVAVMALALGAGANTSIFSVVNAVLLRPLPFKDADRLLTVWSWNRVRGFNTDLVSRLDYADWRSQNQVFEDMAASTDATYTLTGFGEPYTVTAYQFSANFFDVLGVTPLLGRTFRPDEEEPGKNHVVVLGHRLWQSRFGADRNLVGKTITLDDAPYTVIGVLPSGIDYPGSTELWTPLVIPPEAVSDRGYRFLRIVARLKHGITIQQSQSQMNAIARRLSRQYPATNKDEDAVNIIGLRERTSGDIRPALLVLLCAVGFVLLIACANIANLLLVQAVGRQREVAIRAALGASRARLVRQFLTESLVLGVAGGMLGLLLAFTGTKALVAMFPPTIANLNIPRMEQIPVDGRVLAFALAISLLSALIFGLIPGLHAARPGTNEALKESERGLGGGSSRRLRHTLVAAEVALSVVLLAAAGLTIKSLAHLLGGDLGFNPQNVLTLRLLLSPHAYPTELKQVALSGQVLNRLQSLPGVESAGAVTFLPLSGWWGIRGVSPAQSAQKQPRDAVWSSVTPGYFHAMRIPLVKGRLFTDRDASGQPPVAIVSQALARQLAPNGDLVDRHINVEGLKPPATVVGVVGDVHQLGMTSEMTSGIYLPFAQVPVPLMCVAIRSANDPASLAKAAQREIWAVDKDQAVSFVMTMPELVSESVAPQRVITLLLGVFAGMALLMALVGIYAVVSFSVAQRTHEIGVRMALGARSGDVLKLVAGQGLVPVAVGLAFGIACSFGLLRFLSSLLYGVRPSDPLTLTVVSLVLAGAALLASYVPARRAAKVDPMVALRYE